MRRLIKKISYKDLKDMPSLAIKESLVNVNKYDITIISEYGLMKKPENLSDNIFVLDSLAKKLANVNQKIKNKNKNFVLKIVYGYRPFKVQEVFFNEVMNKLILSGRKFSNELDFFEEIHKSIAVPKTAGHPAGAAVDVTIFNKENKKCLDMGSKISDFYDEKMTWFTKGLTKKQEENRKLLLESMLSENFAPFWGEWWHYSFGDREWAVYYKKKTAMFDIIEH